MIKIQENENENPVILYDLKEISKILDFNRQVVVNLIKKGKLKAIKIKNKLYVKDKYLFGYKKILDDQLNEYLKD